MYIYYQITCDQDMVFNRSECDWRSIYGDDGDSTSFASYDEALEYIDSARETSGYLTGVRIEKIEVEGLEDE